MVMPEDEEVIRKEKVNQIRIGIILSYVSMGCNMVVHLLYTPIMIRLLGQSEYGLYTLVGSVVSYLSLFSLGFNGAYLKFYARYMQENNKQKIDELNGIFILLYICMSVLALFCGILLSNYSRQIFGVNLSVKELEKATLLFRILVINIALCLLNVIFDSFISAHERFLFQRVLNILGLVANPFIGVPFLIAGFGSVTLVCVTTVITIVKLIINIWYSVKKLKISFHMARVDICLIKEITQFSFFIFLNMIIEQINLNVDKLILGRVSGTSAVAVYGVASQFNLAYLQFSTTISTVFAPKINRIAAENSKAVRDQFTELFIKVGRIQFLILAFIASGFVFLGKYFITDIYVTVAYKDAYVVVLLLILPATISLMQNIGLEIQKAVNKHQFQAITYFGMTIVNVILSVPLAKKWGAVGTAVGTCVSLLMINGLIMNIFYYKVIGINILQFWKNIFFMLRGMIPVLLLGIVISHFVIFDGILQYGICVLVYIVMYSMCVWFRVMNESEKNIILTILSKICRWKRLSKKNSENI